MMANDSHIEWNILEYDLRDLVNAAKDEYDIDAIYCFGSRNFQTGSYRSDIDILFETNSFIKPLDLRKFIKKNCKALDIFLLHEGRATSASNESYIGYGDNAQLLKMVHAQKLWCKAEGLASVGEEYFIQRYADHVDFIPTALPNIELPATLERLKAKAASKGLPTEPLIGINEEAVAKQLLTIAERIVQFRKRDFPGSGSAKESFVLNPVSEYDYQDIFTVAVKPWLPQLQRENTEIIFDDQRKKSDFSLFSSRFIIEMKYAKDKADKREIAKTLDGLSTFYSNNSNVEFLLFLIFAQLDADIDKALWEDQYSNKNQHRKTVLRVIQIP